MPGKTKISWATDSWNAATGCVEISDGCTNCYAKAFAERFRGTPGHAYEQGFDLRLWPERLDVPLRWTKPRVIFANSMSDMFWSKIPTEFIVEMYAVMALGDWHTFQVLTKRPKRMRNLLGSTDFWRLVSEAMARRTHGERVLYLGADAEVILPNVWHGVTVENRENLSRVELLENTPTAVSFVSAEPLVGPIVEPDTIVSPFDNVDWVIIGGESGPGARPFEPKWALDIIHATSPFTSIHMKQMGTVWARTHGFKGKGDNPSEWPPEYQVREYPPQFHDWQARATSTQSDSLF